MQVHCPQCRAKILADDIGLDTRMAKCRGCNNVFQFAAPAEVSREEAPAPRPSKFRVTETPGEIEITWRWFKPAHLFMAFFAVAWDSFLVFWYTMAFKTGTPWIMKVFPIAHVAVGVGITYATLTGFWNRTTVRASREEISVRSGPLPLRRNRAIPTSDLQRIYAVENGRTRNGITSWRLAAMGRDGAEVVLFASLDDETQARYLAQQLGKCLV